MKELNYNQLAKHVKKAEEMEVSKIARAPGGFVGALKKARTVGNLSPQWKVKRLAFIARHHAQYKLRPSLRRRLALLMWAFDPDA